MGNEQHAAIPALQESFQPIDGFDIQVVGWFVEQQHVRRSHQRASQQHAPLHAAGQPRELRIAVQIELGQRLADALIQRPALGRIDLGLHLAEGFGIEDLGVAELMELGQPVTQFTQPVGHHVEHTAAGSLRNLLLQPRDPHALLHAHFAVIGLELAGNQFHQGRFAGTVAADQGDTLTRLDRQVGFSSNNGPPTL